MNILSVSKEEGKAVIRFGSDELVLLEDSLCLAEKQLETSKRLKTLYELQYGIRIAMDLSRYGHVDEWSFDRLAECRNKAKDGHTVDEVTNIETVLKGLRICTGHAACNGCPYIDSPASCSNDLMRDSLSIIERLIKLQKQRG